MQLRSHEESIIAQFLKLVFYETPRWSIDKTTMPLKQVIEVVTLPNDQHQALRTPPGLLSPSKGET